MELLDGSALAAYPLHAACHSGSLDDVRALLQGGAPVDDCAFDEDGALAEDWRRAITALIVASREDRLDVVGEL